MSLKEKNARMKIKAKQKQVAGGRKVTVKIETK